MSTSYYRLRAPFTSVREEWDGGPHTRLHLWVNHASCGYITVRNEEVPSVLCGLTCGSAVTRVGLPGGGSDLVWDLKVNDSDILISEFGELLTVRKLKEMCGEPCAE